LLKGLRDAIDPTTRGADGKKLSRKYVRELRAGSLELENRGLRFLSGSPDTEEGLMSDIVAAVEELTKCLPRANHAPLNSSNILPAYARILDRLKPEDKRSRIVALVKEEIKGGKLSAAKSIDNHVLQVTRLRPEWEFIAEQMRAANEDLQ